MIDKNYAPVCGVYCGDCSFLGDKCKGCGYTDGKPFWAAQIPSGLCPIHDCCRSQKEMEHCGRCGDFPCKIFLGLRDPNMSDEEFDKSLETRQEALKNRAEIGTEKWLLETPSLP
ncbi:MAG: DUF3795 domain-containing protein [Thermodesulfobacteriota bacterium]|nr:DUF3795 domain-containing protein [Thermodesulfobacteriota bacterium]